MFQAFGHPNVQVLDGGLAKWIGEGKDIKMTDETVKEEDYLYNYQPVKVRLEPHIKNFELHEKHRNFLVVDGRSEKKFSAGHILGSINFPIARIID